MLGEESLEGALGTVGAANADGTVDDDDTISEHAVDAAAGAAAAWEVALPPGLEATPDEAAAAAAAAATVTARAAAEEAIPAEGRHSPAAAAAAAAAAEAAEAGGGDRYARYAGASTSDVTVWVDPLDGTREFVEGPEHWSGVTVLIGIAVGGVPVAGVIHQPFVDVHGVASTTGVGRTLWGALGLGAWVHEGRQPLSAEPLPPPRAAIPGALRVATTRQGGAGSPSG